MNTRKKIISIPIWMQYILTTLILFILIIFLYCIQDIIGYQTVSLILLLIIFLLPLLNIEKGPIILSAFISAIVWDYYFIPPRFTLHIDKAEDVMMLIMFFLVAITNGIMTSRLRMQKNEMTEKERRSNAFYSLLKDLSVGKDLDELTKKAVQHISDSFGAESVIFYSTTHNKINREPHPASLFKPDETEWFVAELSFVNKRETGKTTNTSPNANAIYFPLMENDRIFGVIGVKINKDIDSESEELEFLRNFIQEITSYLEGHINYPIS